MCSLKSQSEPQSAAVGKTRCRSCTGGGNCGESKSVSDSSASSPLPVLAESPQLAPSNVGNCGEANVREGLLAAPEHVLSTLDQDGKRRWLRPRLATGRWWRRRRIVAYLLMVVFVSLPHLQVAGRPLILLDIGAREFTVFGRTFLPTDTLLLALLLLTVFLAVVLVTAITGRAWCGWACPHTVYMEFLFRPIDRLFEGTRGKGGQAIKGLSGWRQVARLGVYLVLCMFVAHTFLAYFVGTERLSRWVTTAPTAHPTAFLVMAGTTALMLFHFLYFREQLCLIACPYGRFQSVMLDQHSLIVAYDYGRGEPRKKGKHQPDETVGDCVDCNQCVVVCPTGIDIRDGLQMECVNCTQCIDACDRVMDLVGSPRGLIRFSSQDAIARKPQKLLRPRTIVYPLLLCLVASGLAIAIHSKGGFDARILRGKGAPFTINEPRSVLNNFSVRLVNRTHEQQIYRLALQGLPAAELDVVDTEKLTLAVGATTLVPFHIRFPSHLTSNTGHAPVTLLVSDGAGHQRDLEFQLLGPR